MGRGRSSRGSRSSKIKGFTLVEMIVVIAIIGILAMAISGVYRGYMRSSTIEANNERAHLAYTGFQNILIQSEIKQDDLLFNGKNMSVYGTAMTGTEDVPKTSEITFTVVQGQITGYSVFTTEYQGTPAGTQSPHKHESGATSSKSFQKFVKEVSGEVTTMDDGTYKVYVDYANYEVRSVLYSETAGYTSSGGFAAKDEFTATYFKEEAYAIDYKTKYLIFNNIDGTGNNDRSNRKAYDAGKHLGCYPTLEATTTT